MRPPVYPLAVFLALLAVALAAPPARAQEKPTPHLPLKAVTHSSPKVQKLVQRATAEYEAGDSSRALADAQEAYDIDPLAELLYDLGLIQRSLRHYELAAFLLRGYLRNQTTAPDYAAVDKLAREMDDAAGQGSAPALQPAVAPITAPPPPPGPKPSGS